MRTNFGPAVMDGNSGFFGRGKFVMHNVFRFVFNGVPVRNDDNAETSKIILFLSIPYDTPFVSSVTIVTDVKLWR